LIFIGKSYIQRRFGRKGFHQRTAIAACYLMSVKLYNTNFGEDIMLKSLLKGVSMGTGMGIGQELTGAIIQNVLGKKGSGNNNAGNSAADRDIQCGKCGEISTGDSKFCGGCGNALVTRCILQSGIKCSCGFMNAQGQKFCSECGNRLTN
jgi:hypothetical protein